MTTNPKTVEEFEKLSVNMQGALWPLCKSCGHIAQSHDTHILTDGPNEKACCELVSGQCPTCSQHAERIPCKCLGYDGPPHVDALIEYLNPLR